jgi:FPC/CPF motif-containing protein YcgG
MADTSITQQLTTWIESETFSCLGAKASLKRGSFRHVEVPAMGSVAATEELHRALVDFVAGQLNPDQNFATLVAVFDGPFGLPEPDFHDLMWRQLGALHVLDTKAGFAWAKEADSDPESPKFGFSVAGHPFFLVGMHPNSSRITRRFTHPAIAFNSHHQFKRLVENGVYGGFQVRIREREMRLQDSINPNLAEFGVASEARQYTGMATDAQWRCPFRPGGD